MPGPVMLIIRDGWGINPGGKDKREENGDATLLAHTPFHDELYRRYPGSKLSASGPDVGLPEGQWAIPRSAISIWEPAGSFIRTSLGSTKRSPMANSRGMM